MGRVALQKCVKGTATIIVLNKMRHKLEGKTSGPSLHTSFTGASSIRNITVAANVDQLLAKMGYARHIHIVIATCNNHVGQYDGHTAPYDQGDDEEGNGQAAVGG